MYQKPLEKTFIEDRQKARRERKVKKKWGYSKRTIKPLPMSKEDEAIALEAWLKTNKVKSY